MINLKHNLLMNFTKDKPMKQIDVGGKPYLQRYFIGTGVNGEDLWLHRFLGADVVEHVHNHPFVSYSLMLCGQYTEDVYGDDRMHPHVVKPVQYVEWIFQSVIGEEFPHLPLHSFKTQGQLIDPFTWHRITRAEKDTWTLMIVEPARLPFWYFREPDGSYTTVESSPRDWYKGAKTR